MRLLCTVLLCLGCCGCTFAKVQEVPPEPKTVQVTITEAPKDFTDKEPQGRMRWLTVLIMSASMLIAPIILSKRRQL